MPESTHAPTAPAPPAYTGTLGRCDIPDTISEQLRLAEILAGAREMVPERFRDRREAIVAAMLHARALDITLWTVMHHTFVTEQGSHGMHASLMHGLVTRAGHQIVVVAESEKGCTLRLLRWDRPDAELTASFSYAEAVQAGLADHNPWRKYPADMMYARALARLVRRHAREYVLGFGYLPDELNGDAVGDRQVAAADASVTRVVAQIVADCEKDGVTRDDVQAAAVRADKATVMMMDTEGGEPLREYLQRRWRELGSEAAEETSSEPEGPVGESAPADTEPSEPVADPAVLDCGCVKVEVIAGGDHRHGCARRTGPVAVNEIDPFELHRIADEGVEQ